MTSRLWRPALGVFLAIAITTTMDAGGLAAFSALALLPLLALFWYLDRLRRPEAGFVGLVLNLAFASVLWFWWNSPGRAHA